jgi:NAD(P)-dependent dehydrogenase (short-subunit alcohol dehydrogenase family)
LKSTSHAGHRVSTIGASKGVGKRTTIAFAESGTFCIGVGALCSLDDVAAVVESATKNGEHKGPKVLTAKLDVLDQESAGSAAKKFELDFGGLDILVNNAGWLEMATPIVDSDAKDWWYTMEFNIKDVYLSTRASYPCY